MNKLALLSLAALVAAATAPGFAQPADPASQRDTTSDVALADVVMLVRIDP